MRAIKMTESQMGHFCFELAAKRRLSGAGQHPARKAFSVGDQPVRVSQAASQ